MYCDKCGAQIQDDQKFCNACGNPIRRLPPTPPPVYTARGRVARHIQVLGILWIVISVFRLFPGIFLLGMRGFSPPGAPFEVRQLIGMIFTIGGWLLILAGVAGLAAGIGLLKRLEWARMLTIVIACVSLIDIPFGLALGIYSLWVLLPAESEEDYRAMAQT